MYHTKNHQDGYCLLSYDMENRFAAMNIYQTMSYCLRTSEEDKFIAGFNFQNTIDPSFTFAELKDKDITSQMLLHGLLLSKWLNNIKFF